MASEWKEVALSNIIEITHGYAFPGENIRDAPNKNVLVTPGNFAIGGGFKADKFKYFDGIVPEDYVLRTGDIVVTMTDLSKQADTLGYSAIIPQLSGVRFLHNQRIGKVIIKDHKAIDPHFLYYLLQTKEYRDEVLASATGTSIKHTAPSRILSYRAQTPNHLEQQAIAEKLKIIDDKIELNLKMNETLEAMARALFQSWFVDFDPIHAKAEGRDTGLSASIAALFPDSFEDSELEQLPNVWKQIPLYEIAVFSNGAAYRDMHFSPIRAGLPVIKIAELKAGVTGSTKFTTTELGSKYRIDQKEILFSWSGNPDTSIDTFIWDGGAAWLNQHIFRVRENGIASRTWIYCLLKSLRPVFSEIARDKQTTGLGHVTIADMKRLMVCRPPPEVAKAFDTFAAPILERVFSNQLQINLLKDIRDNLLPKLISGEIRVGESHQLQSAEIQHD
jgi:type I restriction enzyme S subunit